MRGMLGRARAIADRETTRVVGFLAAWKALFYGYVFFAIELLPHSFSKAGYWANFHFPPAAPPGPWIQLQTWDAQHYLYLAEHGYHAGDSSTAFFPLWPYAIRAATPLFGGSHLLAGLVLAGLLSIAGLTLFWQLVRDSSGDREVADTALLLAIAYPGALFFNFVYSEALFLLIAVVTIRALARDEWRTACLAAFLLPLVRGVGIFIGLPMLYVLIRQWRESGVLPWRRALGLAAPLLGLGVYFLFISAETGSALTGFDAQVQFISMRSLADLWDVGGLVTSFFTVEFDHWFHTAFLDRLFYLCFLAALVALWRRDRLGFFYALLLGLVPPMTSFMSYTRYLVVVFPVFAVAGQLLAGERARRVRWTVLGAMLALQALLTVRYVNFLWAG